jgi:hypothetical protein
VPTLVISGSKRSSPGEELVPWASDEWQAAGFEKVLSLDLTVKDSASLMEVIRKDLTNSGFSPQSRRLSDPGAAQVDYPTEAAVTILFERKASLDFRTASRDLLMPDGSWIVIVGAILLGIVVAFGFATGITVVGHPWALVWIVSPPLVVLVLWSGARSRRFIRTVAIKVSLVTKPPSTTEGVLSAVTLDIEAAKIRSKLTYPRPLYQPRRTLVDSEGTAEVSALVSGLRSSLAGPSPSGR